jgi:sulfur carrier protein ThiS
MSSITLVIIPGPGAKTVNIQNNITTISNLLDSESISNRDIIVNGRSVPRSEWSTYSLSASDEVFATSSVKGNALVPSSKGLTS